MLKTLGVVELATGQEPNSRLPSPKLLPIVAGRLNDYSLVEWTVRRVTESQLVNGVIVVLGREPIDDKIAALVPPDVPVFQSHSPDPLVRLLEAIVKFPAKAVIRVQMDSPFVDPELIDRLVADAIANPESDYIGYRSSTGRNAASSKLGVFAEWCRSSALRKAHKQKLLQASDTRGGLHSEGHREADLCSLPNAFHLRFLPVPTQLDRTDVRLTIQQDEDWDVAQDIVEALGPERLDWREIAGLLDEHPAMRQRMAALNEAELTV